MNFGCTLLIFNNLVCYFRDFKKNSNFIKGTTRAIIGAVIYKIIGGVAIDLGLNPNDLKAINAIILIAFISYNNFAIDIFGALKKKEGKRNVKNSKPIKEF